MVLRGHRLAENKLQIIANLANFGYDPINYGFFRTLNVLDLFLDVLAEAEDGGNSSNDYDDMMKQFAIGGICNCCLGLLYTMRRGGANAHDLLQTGSIKHISLRMMVYIMQPSAWIGMWHAFTSTYATLVWCTNLSALSVGVLLCTSI